METFQIKKIINKDLEIEKIEKTKVLVYQDFQTLQS